MTATLAGGGNGKVRNSGRAQQMGLLVRWRAGDKHAGQALLDSVERLVWQKARSLARRRKAAFGDEQELIQDLAGVGMRAAWEAIARFEPARRMALTTYVGARAYGVMRHYLRDEARMIRIPSGWQDKRSQHVSEDEWPRTVATDDEFPEMADDGGIEELLDRLVEKPRVAQAVSG